jgi:hypothetical protein
MTDEQRPRLRKAPDAHAHPTAGLLNEDTILSGSTSDAIRKDKLVTVEVEIPKSLRKTMRAEARHRGITLDALVIEALRARG